MKKLAAAALLLCLLLSAASAQALPYTMNLYSSTYPGEKLVLTLDYTLLVPGSQSMATITLQNAMTTPRGIVSFALNLPSDGAGVASVSLASTTNPYFHLVSPSAPYAPNAVSFTAAPSIPYDVGLSIGPNLNHGPPSAYYGILNGQAATFSLLFSGSGQMFTLSDIQSVLSLLSAQSTNPFHVLVSSYNAPTPIPGAVWLLGSGLVGIMGFKRRRRGA